MNRNSKDMNWAVAPQRSLPEAVAERVTEAIRIGALRPGQRIIEKTLAQQLGVSRGPLREALKSLEANHLVETRRARGTYVAQPTPAQLMEMVAVRAALEGLAARLVAGNATPDVIAQLKRQHVAIRKEATAGRADRWRDLDWQFHELVCKLSGNEFLLRAWQQHSNLIRLFLHNHFAYDRDVESVLHNHEDFIDALSSQNPDRAEAVFRAAILKSGYSGVNAPVPEALAGLIDVGRYEKRADAAKTSRRAQAVG
jgi:DNA-binding GntR family transcriptional regulator